MRQPLGKAKIQDALRILRLERDFIILVPLLIITGQLREERVGGGCLSSPTTTIWRHLATAPSVDGLNLKPRLRRGDRRD
jgi:hypothetical protein